MLTALKFNQHNTTSTITPRDVPLIPSMLKLTRFDKPIIKHSYSLLHVNYPVFSAFPMSANSEKTEIPPLSDPAGDKVEKPPTPPEKPEAGDCCGSGCVRCVWDIYDEQLEDYNKLLQEFNSKNKS